MPARRWWALATVASAQFLAVADAFIVNVAMPSIRADLHADAAEIQAVVAVYQIAYAALVITGGRLGDIVGRKRVFLAGVLGFTVASLWCGLSGSAAMLIFARAAQGGAAAMMVPQVLARSTRCSPKRTSPRLLHLRRRHRPWRAVGFMLGGWLVTLNLAGLGWRSIFCVNVPIGLAIALAASRLMPDMARNAGTKLDPGAQRAVRGAAWPPRAADVRHEHERHDQAEQPDEQHCGPRGRSSLVSALRGIAGISRDAASAIASPMGTLTQKMLRQPRPAR